MRVSDNRVGVSNTRVCVSNIRAGVCVCVCVSDTRVGVSSTLRSVSNTHLSRPPSLVSEDAELATPGRARNVEGGGEVVKAKELWPALALPLMQRLFAGYLDTIQVTMQYIYIYIY